MIWTKLSWGQDIWNQNTTTCVSFLHVRRCGPDGWVGPVLRPDQAALSADVVEVGGMELSCLDRLALLKMVRAGDDLRYVITVMDVLTGVELASLPSYGASILGCVQVNKSLFCQDNDYYHAFLSSDACCLDGRLPLYQDGSKTWIWLPDGGRSSVGRCGPD